jgi:adenylyltransferase/sulfurtransferase
MASTLQLDEKETKRYARQMIIPGWGEETQRKLKRATVFVAGAGGLGSPVSVALALAGVGTIRICDFDSPDLSNLNRQFLHDESRIGINKAESARMTLSRLNPNVKIEPVTDKIVAENVDALAEGCDLILDCMDNFPTRFVLNDFSVRRRVPMVHASLWGFEGRVAFFQPPETACLSCFFKEAPPKEVFPVLGATPGITGMMQAMEAIKYLSGVGSLLKGRYLCCDYAEMRFSEVAIAKDPACRVCGSKARVPA